jgi:hypothetical protein
MTLKRYKSYSDLVSETEPEFTPLSIVRTPLSVRRRAQSLPRRVTFSSLVTTKVMTDSEASSSGTEEVVDNQGKYLFPTFNLLRFSHIQPVLTSLQLKHLRLLKIWERKVLRNFQSTRHPTL